MTGLVIAEAVAIALLGLLVAGLLRSHAEILRALHELRVGSPAHAHDAPAAASSAKVVSELDFPGVREGIAPPRSIDVTDDATRVTDISGITPWDESVAAGVSGDEGSSLIAFLSTGCGTCANFWDELNQPAGARLPEQTRLVVVTKGEDEESISALRRIAPQNASVIMSSQAWADYQVPGSPYFLLIEGGRVTGEGSGSTWQQVRALLGQASDDNEVRRSRRAPALNGRDRADRIDAELAAAGIMPGHPSLYPDAPVTDAK
ncbi:MAG TPA: hypothetical protein VHX15_15020 [Frankiaceae bacterium]|jgi:hypothetical protein|nr:hypothetical protein [Frankiaceae bacterium]